VRACSMLRKADEDPPNTAPSCGRQFIQYTHKLLVHFRLYFPNQKQESNILLNNVAGVGEEQGNEAKINNQQREVPPSMWFPNKKYKEYY